ncbi:uncharacterized protein BO97DRAFT_426654 [Aspergillus homomorphus CBS 101889]|uniref:ferric-chelate reductase (NADPH) n=1 Tax=Aspergillus homomorphus (strain CBS 101889) TaxID=1450537 RepID=A0A395HRL1_ASPHC|nr:hypothetical protein BO97DRAFT_426654 [Aspergillus homomorphus CBS 101889]RAL10129.1 hypothetical protein BO97DRAFT_426654 [Aspergillus homomorphus CBS 101889]
MVNQCYEFFRFSHYVAALVFIIFLFFHCDFRLSSWNYFIATAAVSRQTLEITISTSRVHWRTGQHLFLRFLTPDAHMFTTHLFTIASLPSALDPEQSELVFYALVPQGTTRHLLARATSHDASQAVASTQARILAAGLPGREIWLHQEGFRH